jgi:pyruvate/2-oxoglutarate/acetoin dehydrogenase E1 component
MKMTTSATFRSALTNALRDEMRADPRVVVLGETVATGGGAARVTLGLADEFGRDRVIETPVSENAIVGAALGCALAGLVVVAEVYSADFLWTAGSEVINDIAKWRYQHRWKKPLHLVLRMPMGNWGVAAGPEHSQCIEGYLHHTPGLTVLVPGAAGHAGRALTAAMRCGNPVIFLEHRRLYEKAASGREDQAAESAFAIGRAQLVRCGTDATVVAWGWMRDIAEQAAEALANDGVSIELIDPITIKPLDIDRIRESVEKTRRLLVVEESPITGSVGAEIVARMVEDVDLLRGHALRLAMPDVPHPYSRSLETAPIPNADAVRARIRTMVELPVPA